VIELKRAGRLITGLSEKISYYGFLKKLSGCTKQAINNKS
jgi:hypothetical protein